MNESKNIAEVTRERFSAIAPQGMTYEKEKSFADLILKNNQQLSAVACNHASSFQQAVVNVAAIGLSLNPAEKLAYLISRNVKVKEANGRERWESRIYLEPSYMGLCKLATDSGSIKWVQAKLIHDKDNFIDHGPGLQPTHDYQACRPRGELIGVFCVAKTTDGDYLTEVMELSEIQAIRDRSESWKQRKSGPWATDFNEQAKKTVVRRAYKMWPKTNMHRMAIAVDLSNENEGFEPLVSSPSYGKYTVEQKEYLDQLIEQNDCLGMKVFSLTVDEQVFINLYHSFPKGEKGKYQKVIDAMTAKGHEILQNYIESIRVALSKDDQAGLEQYLGEIDNQTIGIVESYLSGEEKAVYDSMVK